MEIKNIPHCPQDKVKSSLCFPALPPGPTHHRCLVPPLSCHPIALHTQRIPQETSTLLITRNRPNFLEQFCFCFMSIEWTRFLYGFWKARSNWKSSSKYSNCVYGPLGFPSHSAHSWLCFMFLLVLPFFCFHLDYLSMALLNSCRVFFKP